VNGKQKRAKRLSSIDGMDVDDFIMNNADPIFLHQNELWEYMDQPKDSNNPDRADALTQHAPNKGRYAARTRAAASFQKRSG
jgi:hypothetical protein